MQDTQDQTTMVQWIESRPFYTEKELMEWKKQNEDNNIVLNNRLKLYAHYYQFCNNSQ